MKKIFPLAVIMTSVAMLSACAADSDIDKEGKIRWKQDQQMVLVLSSDWNANQGVLLQFEYQHHQWVHMGQSFTVSLGKNGTVWGIGGRHPINQRILKAEGDMRSPAGIFTIGTSFGYANRINSHYPYKALDKDDYCIDNSQSSYYNQIVNLQKISFNPSQDSTEPMRRDLHLNGDQLYKLGLVLNYNPKNIPGAGSCIFVHLRKNSNATTAGCTSMDEQNMHQLIGWLNAKKKPVFVLLPIEAYQQKQQEWNLPKVIFSSH